MKKSAGKRVALLGMLTAVMLVLGFVEYMFPVASAVPGMKLGLSNVVLLFALYMLGPRDAAILMVSKVVLSGLLFGGVNAMMFSLAGGMLSMLGMMLTRRIPGVSIVGVSVVGAVLHNAGQVLVAMLVLRTGKLLYYMAILMLVAVGTGVVTGIVAKLVMRALGQTKLLSD